ncbi:3-dehydrosphinganine reductase [Aureococcus anophagefferens]|nr:3-dehydrosphinganine reductase [Aureococcus anophagefferens]
MDLNYLGVVKTLKATLPGMVDRKAGTAVLVSSGLALCGYAGYSAYAPTKWAVRGLAETLRSELLPFDISVHSVYPPNMDTPGFVEENRTKPKSAKAIEGRADDDPKAWRRPSWRRSTRATSTSPAATSASACSRARPTARRAHDAPPRVVALPVIAVIGCVYRRMWDRIVRATPN